MEYADLGLVSEILKDAGADERLREDAPRLAAILMELGDVLEPALADVETHLTGERNLPLEADVREGLLFGLDEAVKGNQG